MKKTIRCMLALFLALMLALLSACSSPQDSYDASAKITIDENGVVTWKAVRGAVEYEYCFVDGGGNLLERHRTRETFTEIAEGLSIYVWPVFEDGSAFGDPMVSDFYGEPVFLFGNSETEIDDKNVKLVLTEGEVSSWTFDYSGSIEDIVVTSSDENTVDIISLFMPSGDESLSITQKAFSVGEATITVKTVDGEIIKTAHVLVEDQSPVYIGEGELCRDIAMDKTEAEVYKDDTTVTYTVTTSNAVDKIELIQWEQGYDHHRFETFIDFKQSYPAGTEEIYRLEIDENKLVDTLTLDESSGKYYSAARSASGDQAVWTIKWDLGDTAVKFVQINTIDRDTDTVQENYVRLNIHYPQVDASLGLESIIERWVELNLDKPFLYEVDTRTLTDEQMELYLSREGLSMYADEIFVLLGMPQARSELTGNDYKIDEIDNQTLYYKIFDASPIYRGNFADYFSPCAMVTELDSTTLAAELMQTVAPQCSDRVLVGGVYEERTHMFYYPITDEIRAVIAYQNGFEIDAEKFPYAHSILERSREVLEEIITDGMTDFEKERAIYTWMMEHHYANQDNYKPSPEDEYELTVCTKTAYGLLNGYYGDCMGWSGTFFTLCNMAGVECATVSSQISPEGGPTESFFADHRINLVRLDGEYYFVDSYWSWQNGEAGEYNTLNMTSEVASKSYKWMNEEGFGPVECNYETYLVDAYTGELLNK